MATQKIIPHLWFDTQARQAAEFYCSVFPNTSITSAVTLGDTPSGDTEIISFTIDGYQFMSMSAGPMFKINPSVSFSLNFSPANDPLAIEKLKQLWGRLSENGIVRMPLDAYPFSQCYGWVEDQFGVNWQLVALEPGAAERPFIVPSLLFVTDSCTAAEEAISFYTSLFQNSSHSDFYRYPVGMGANKEGSVMHCELTLDGQFFTAMDGSSSEHAFKFNEAVSLIVNCADQAEIDYFWDALSADPDAEACGWLRDKFGLSWQIVPEDMERHMSGDPDAVARATAALLEMKKLDIAALDKAARGE